jgi:outer membrane protein OmpA-like peptidoglycan-associated protein
LIASSSLWLVDFAVNAGFKIRTDETLKNPGYQELGVGQLFFASAAARLKIFEKDNISFSFLSDLFMATTLSSVNQEEVPIEWLNGIEAKLPHGFGLLFGAGVSLTRGVGSPQPRLFAGLSWAWQKKECKKPFIQTLIGIIEKPVPVEKECKPVIKEKDTLVVKKIYFDTDKSTLRPRSIRILDEVVDILVENPCIKRINLEGYCDHRASALYNIGLSKRRVQSAVNYLKSKGVSVERLEQRYYGEMYPEDTTKTEKGMQLNRRVDIYLTNRKCEQ